MSKVFYLLLFLAVSCRSISDSQQAQLASTKSLVGSGASSTTLSLESLQTDEEIVSLAKEASGIVQNGSSLKFLIDLKKTRKIYYINANYKGRCSQADCTAYHYNFAQEKLKIRMSTDTFNDVTYFTNDKQFVAGTLGRYQLASMGTVYGIQLYPQDVANTQNILEVAKYISESAPATKGKLFFVPTGNQQSTVGIEPQLSQLAVGILPLNKIIGDANFFPMNTGVAYGFLRVFPETQEDLTPTDIVAFDNLPLDLTVVAGTITRAFQDTNSHINLKSKERGTPNMVLRDISLDHPDVLKYKDKPVKLTITKNGYTLEDSTEEEVIGRYKRKKASQVWTKVGYTSSREMLSYDKMCAGEPAKCLSLGKVFGSKAAHLGFLKEIFRDKSLPSSKPLAYDPVPVGFGVPLQFYDDFLDANPGVKAKVASLAAKAKEGLMSPAELSAVASEVRQAILNAKLPDAQLKPMLALMAQISPSVTKWKIRSSANTEDIKNFDGAGLHDSYSANLSKKDYADSSCKLEADKDSVPGEVADLKVSPKTVACAVKGVYASLWNRRAIDERSYAGYDHASVAMGLTVLPTYDTESPVAANSVVVTRVVGSPDIYGYSLSIQRDNNTVTNPLANTWSENTIAALPTGDGTKVSLSTIRFAKPTASEAEMTKNVLTEPLMLQMIAMTIKVEEAYCRAKKADYYPSSRMTTRDCKDVSWDMEKPSALDLEFKYLQNGEFVLKQVREFGGK